jgi:hypothetical protein
VQREAGIDSLARKSTELLPSIATRHVHLRGKAYAQRSLLIAGGGLIREIGDI